MARRSPRKRLALVTAIVAVATGAWIGFDCAYRPRLLTGPMVQQLEPDGFTLVWNLHPPVPAVLEVNSESGSSPTVELRREHDRTLAVVKGLSAGLEHGYAIRAAFLGRQIDLFTGSLRTAPASGGPFRFIALGDTGDAGPDQLRIAAMLLDHDPDLVIHTGDLIYDRGQAEDYDAKFYRPYRDLLARVPFYPSLGNHDCRNSEDPAEQGRPLLDNFVLPENGPPGRPPEREYWFDFGNVRFVALDSNQETPVLRDAVAPWLDGVLASAGPRWKIVFFHHPPYTGGKHEPAGNVLEALVPVFDRHGVELVFCGHNHLYERTHPLRGGQPVGDGEGTVYITTGAGGAGLYQERVPAPGCMAAWYDQRHSFTVVDVGPDHVRLRQINDRGEEVDSSVVTRAVKPPI
ncbi:MAG: metallophosphoesterase [Phycisphaerae bacterium]